MKRILSMILALSLIIGVFCVVSFSASGVSLDETKAYVKIDDRYFEVEKGESFTYTYYLTVPDVKISSFDARTSYDTDGLDFVPDVDEYGDDDLLTMFPVFKNVVFNYTTHDGWLYYNYSSTVGARVNKEDSIAFTGEFVVTADSGVFEIKTELIALADTNMNKIKFNGVVYGEFVERFELPELVPVPDETQEETQPSQDVTQETEEVIQPTEEIKPTAEATHPSEPTVPSEPTEPTEIATDPSDIPTESDTEPSVTPTAMPTISEAVYVKADGVTYELKQGDVFTYVFNLACSEKIAAIDAETLYSTSGLEFVPDTDEFGDYDLLTMFPVLKDVVYNFKNSGRIVFNFSSIAGVRLPLADDLEYTDNNQVFVGKFKVTASSGVFEINTRIKTLGDLNAKGIIFNYEKVNEDVDVKHGGEVQLVLPPEPTTETTPTEEVRPTEPTEEQKPTEEVTQPTEIPTDPSEIPTESDTEPSITPTEMPTNPEAEDVLYGDVNGDGKINIFDASFVQKSIAGYDGYELDERAKKAADVDFNGKVNVFDASHIQKFIAGYFDSFK